MNRCGIRTWDGRKRQRPSADALVELAMQIRQMISISSGLTCLWSHATHIRKCLMIPLRIDVFIILLHVWYGGQLGTQKLIYCMCNIMMFSCSPSPSCHRVFHHSDRWGSKRGSLDHSSSTRTANSIAKQWQVNAFKCFAKAKLHSQPIDAKGMQCAVANCCPLQIADHGLWETMLWVGHDFNGAMNLLGHAFSGFNWPKKLHVIC